MGTKGNLGQLFRAKPRSVHGVIAGRARRISGAVWLIAAASAVLLVIE